MTVQTFAAELTTAEQYEALKIIRQIVREERYMNLRQWPGYQTDDISDLKEVAPLVRSFREACDHFGHYGSFIQLWAYVDRRNRQEQFGHDNTWHNHQQTANVVSGVMYLVNPEQVGTQFQDGTSTDGNCLIWNLFPSDTVHRPGKLLTNEWRYSIAADLRV